MIKNKNKAKRVVFLSLSIFLIITCMLFGSYVLYMVYRPAPDCAPVFGLTSVNLQPTILDKFFGREPVGVCRLTNKPEVGH